MLFGYLITKMDLPINAWQVKVLTNIEPDWLWIDYLKLQIFIMKE